MVSPVFSTDAAAGAAPASHLPDGTVTFLFTDIEGSARLWEENPEAMRVALARHDALLNATITAHGGYIFKTLGDAFCAAFSTASAALNAALAAQFALHREVWDKSLVRPLRARMALHTGAAEERGGDYFGQPLSRVARLLAVGHGGQTLLSLPTEELVRDTLPPGLVLRDLGTRRLKDLSRSERVFQLLHPDLPADFPPLRTLDNPGLPNNLPQQVTSFIGREKEIEEGKRLLEKARLLTLTGSGGCGKTRLSLQIAADTLENYPDGVFLVELGALADPALVPQAAVATLGIKELPGKTRTDTLVEYLKTRCLLLVFDNCEHLLSAVAQLADTLLRSCPRICLLASSREGLNVAGEMTYRVPSLTLPDQAHAGNASLDSLRQYEAVRLFVERATYHRSNFAVTNANAPALAQLCVHLDGIPLAIELAAARVRAMSVEEIQHRLDDRFRLLTGGSRSALPRQQTLRALIDWSYDLLIAPERQLLHRLSVFSGGWNLTAAEQVCAGDGIEAWETLDLLSLLVDKSLALAETVQGETRYRLLETVRQYARDRLSEAGETDTAQANHTHWCLSLAEEAAPHLTGPDQAVWFERLEAEHDNLRTAQENSDSETALRLAAALVWFWFVRGYHAEGRERTEKALAKDKAATPIRARARALTGLAVLSAATDTVDPETPAALYREALAIQRIIGDKHGESIVLNNLGNIARGGCHWDEAIARYEEALQVAHQAGFQRGCVLPTFNLGYIAHTRGVYPEAQSRYEAALALARETGVRSSECETLQQLGLLALDLDRRTAARIWLQAGLDLASEIGFKPGECGILLGLGELACAEGDFVQGGSLLDSSREIAQSLGQFALETEAVLAKARLCLAQGNSEAARLFLTDALQLPPLKTPDMFVLLLYLDTVAALAAQQSNFAPAICLLAFTEAQRTLQGKPLAPFWKEKQTAILQTCHAALDEAAFTTLWKEGSAFNTYEAMRTARRSLEAGSIPGS